MSFLDNLHVGDHVNIRVENGPGYLGEVTSNTDAYIELKPTTSPKEVRIQADKIVATEVERSS